MAEYGSRMSVFAWLAALRASPTAIARFELLVQFQEHPVVVIFHPFKMFLHIEEIWVKTHCRGRDRIIHLRPRQVHERLARV